MTSDTPSRSEPTRRAPCPPYGAHPEAHPAVARFATDVERILEATPPEEIPERVARALEEILATEDLLCQALSEPDADRYCKHVLYADPDRRFTVLALVWLPGQATVVHGHTAWGAVGVYQGTPNVTCYDCHELDDGRHEARPTKVVPCTPGDTATVRPGLLDVHRIANDSDERVVTLHAYGCDLIEDPDAINIPLALVAGEAS